MSVYVYQGISARIFGSGLVLGYLLRVCNTLSLLWSLKKNTPIKKYDASIYSK